MSNIIKFPLTMDYIVDMNKENENHIKKHVIKETSQTFAKKIEDLVWEKDISYFEAVNILMEELNYEPEYVAKLLTQDLYTKIAEEAEVLSLIKKTNRLDL